MEFGVRLEQLQISKVCLAVLLQRVLPSRLARGEL